MLLRELDFDETHLLIRTFQERPDQCTVTASIGDSSKVAQFAYQLTNGHRGGIRIILQTIACASQNGDASRVDVRGLLGRPVTEHGPTLASEVFRLLLGNWDDEIRTTILRSAAARNFGPQELSSATDDESNRVVLGMGRFRSRDLWVSHPHEPADADPPTLHSFPRRVVQHLLTVSDNEGDPTWNTVHHRMCAAAEDRHDKTSAMYHRLALSEIQEVSEYLWALFKTHRTPAWYADLTAITAAPSAHPDSGHNSKEHWAHLTAWINNDPDADEGLTRMTNLVAALQLHTDPLGDPEHALCVIIAQELAALARHPRCDDRFHLLDESERFSNCRAQRKQHVTTIDHQ